MDLLRWAIPAFLSALYDCITICYIDLTVADAVGSFYNLS